jgi:tetratricopeptide (TPR) repeat protein
MKKTITRFYPYSLLAIGIVLLPNRLFSQGLQQQKINKVYKAIDGAEKALKTTYEPDKTIRLLAAVQDDIRKHGLHDAQTKAYLLLGGAYNLKGNYKLSEVYYKQTLSYSKQRRDSVNLLKAYIGLGNVYYETFQWKKLDKMSENVLKTPVSEKIIVQKLQFESIIASSEMARKKYIASLTRYNRVREQLEKREMTAELIPLYFNLSSVYAEIGKNDHAIYFLNKASRLNHGKDKRIDAYVFSTIGGIQANSGKPKSAIKNYESAIRYFKQSNDHKGIMYCDMALAIIYEEQNEIEKAKNYSLDALKYSTESGNGVIKSLHFIVLAKIEQKNGRYQAALKYADSALVYTEQSGDLLRKAESLELKSKLLGKLGDYQQALFFADEFHQLNDSIVNKANLDKLENAELIKSLTLLEKEKLLTTQQLQLKEKDAENARIRFISITSIALLILVFFAMYYFNRMKRLKIKNELIQEKYALQLLNEQNLKLELENEQINKQLLEKDLLLKNSKMLDLAYRITKGNDLLKGIAQEEVIQRNRSIYKQLSGLIEGEKELEYFHNEIQLLESSYQRRLKTQFPALSDYEVRLSTMIKTGLASKEISDLLSIEASSVDVARYRLRKKLGIGKNDDLFEFLNGI